MYKNTVLTQICVSFLSYVAEHLVSWKLLPFPPPPRAK
jgi:hypothetical protein